MNIARRDFLQKLSLALGLLALQPLQTLLPRETQQLDQSAHLRILPVAGEHYPPGFLNFIQKARFSSAQEAISAVRDRNLLFDLAWETV